MTDILSSKSEILSTVPAALRPSLPRMAVYGHLVHSCFSLREDTARAIEKDWQFSASDIDRLGVRSCPSYTGNLLASYSLLQTFSAEVLSQTPGLYCFNYRSRPCACLEFRSDCICHVDWWRIDIDPKHAQRGFILPVRHSEYLFIDALRVFRDTRDRHGFLLKLRTEERRVA